MEIEYSNTMNLIKKLITNMNKIKDIFNTNMNKFIDGGKYCGVDITSDPYIININDIKFIIKQSKGCPNRYDGYDDDKEIKFLYIKLKKTDLHLKCSKELFKQLTTLLINTNDDKEKIFLEKLGINILYSLNTIKLDLKNIRIGKAGRSRWLNNRSVVRGVAMNPIDHPHGGGEGKTSGGRCSVTPWGILTKGYKTNRKKKIKK